MRELRFRAWDGDSMQYDIGIANNYAFDYDHESAWPWHEPAEAIMQYTGLKDKNGKEIYEGDIVKTIYTHHEPKCGEVYFQPTRLNWSIKHSSFTNQDMFVYTRPDCSIEVIGNVYENPELLEKADE